MGGAGLRAFPAGEANQTMDVVRALGLVPRHLVGATLPLVAAMVEAVRPRHQRLATSSRTQLQGPVAVEHISTVGDDGAQPPADLDDGHLRSAEADHVL